MMEYLKSLQTLKPNINFKKWMTSKIIALKDGILILKTFLGYKYLGSWSHTQMPVKEFEHIWVIENFAYCSEEPGQAINSPKFCTSMNEELQWFLQIFPNGDKKANKEYVSLFLVSCNKNPVKAQLEVSILLNSTKVKWRTFQTDIHQFTNNNSWGYATYVRRSFLLQKNRGILNKNNLVISCRITVIGDKSSVSVKCQKSPNKDSKQILEKEFNYLFESQKFADITLASDGQEFRAHKAILVARSSVFAAMFEHEMEEQKSSRVDITDVHFNVLYEMVRFMYTGRASIHDSESAIDLLVAGDKYGLVDLMEICEKTLSVYLSVNTAAETLVIADRYNLKELKIETINFIKIQAANVMKTNGWRILKQSESNLLDEIVKSFIRKKGNTQVTPMIKNAL